jgi:tRNA/tmRNA/rRNA uracil-C5-methylase (TrmA/RlmC/RlmD family)
LKLSFEVGQRIEVVVGPVAHGGHFVARHEGQVIFVRHALPGERVIVAVTSVANNFARADAVSIIEPSSDRVNAPCKYAGECGGCDFQHVSLTSQRKLKSDVISEQFRRLAKIDIRVEVEEVANVFDPEHTGLLWRTRVAFVADSQGRLGLRRNHSHELVHVDKCVITVPSIINSDVLAQSWPANSTVQVVASNGGDQSIVVTDESDRSQIIGRAKVRQRVLGRTFEVAADGFWQVHPGAPEILSTAVVDALSPSAGEVAVDLYAGAGLFTSALLERVGAAGSIHLVESSISGIADAKATFGRFKNVLLHHGDVLRVLRVLAQRGSIDIAVLDPPRSGAGLKVLTALTALKPRRIAYVACDPAALARDCAYLRDLGYFLVGVRAFDLFPMTHHVECVAAFAPVLEPQ